MKNVGELHNQFMGCQTLQHVGSRIAAMPFQEVRELMTFFGVGADAIDLCVCQTLGIKYQSAGDLQKQRIATICEERTRRLRNKIPLFK